MNEKQKTERYNQKNPEITTTKALSKQVEGLFSHNDSKVREFRPSFNASVTRTLFSEKTPSSVSNRLRGKSSNAPEDSLVIQLGDDGNKTYRFYTGWGVSALDAEPSVTGNVCYEWTESDDTISVTADRYEHFNPKNKLPPNFGVEPVADLTLSSPDDILRLGSIIQQEFTSIHTKKLFDRVTNMLVKK